MTSNLWPPATRPKQRESELKILGADWPRLEAGVFSASRGRAIEISTAYLRQRERGAGRFTSWRRLAEARCPLRSIVPALPLRAAQPHERRIVLHWPGGTSGITPREADSSLLQCAP